MSVSLCKHRFPLQPPHGSVGCPGPCTRCGITWDEAQAVLQRQEDALVVGTSRDGTCPDCGRQRRLFRYQPEAQAWHDPGEDMPVTFLCAGCRSNAIDAEAIVNGALYDLAGGAL